MLMELKTLDVLYEQCDIALFYWLLRICGCTKPLITCKPPDAPKDNVTTTIVEISSC